MRPQAIQTYLSDKLINSMLIDGCPHSFADLTTTVLPKHLITLRTALAKPHAASRFSKAGEGPVSIARALGIDSDFSGCYVLMDNGTLIYVGISRQVLARLRQHLTGKTHFDASLAYAMAQRKCPTPGKRGDAMTQTSFQQAFADVKTHLSSLHVAFVQIESPLELYVFEAYAAMELATHEWNTFRTH